VSGVLVSGRSATNGSPALVIPGSEHPCHRNLSGT
jgi:hypothetical protein